MNRSNLMRPAFLPLPGGEGRGEGEQCASPQRRLWGVSCEVRFLARPHPGLLPQGEGIIAAPGREFEMQHQQPRLGESLGADRISGFELLSDFGFRISDFPP